MLNPKKNTLLSTISQADPQYFCLLAALALEFGLMAGGVYGYFFITYYTIFPCMAFLGILMVRKIQPQVRWQLWLGLIAAAWFTISQLQHYTKGMYVQSHGLFFSIYLLAFPFAGFAEDGKKQIGLKLAGLAYIAAALVLVGLTGLLALDALPGFLRPHVYWDNAARLNVMRHPNISGSIFMIAITFCLGFSAAVPKKWHKGLCLAVAALLFSIMSLTNSRTSILMLCAIAGGYVFFIIFRKCSWQRFLTGAIAAVMVIFVLYSCSTSLYKLHYNRLVDQILTEQESTGSGETSPLKINPETGEVSLGVSVSQRGLTNDLKTFNGRTAIWNAAILAIRDNPAILIWGIYDIRGTLAQFAPFVPEHAHNAWIEILLGLGIPGLLIALFFTALAVKTIWTTFWCYDTDVWHKTIALLILCLLGNAFLEPFLFTADQRFHYANFIFFLCLGYLTQQPKKTAA